VVPGQQFATRPTRFLCAAIDRVGDAIAIQVDEPIEDRHVGDALRILAELGPEYAHVTISDRGVPNQIERRQEALLEGLRRAFAAVDVVSAPVPAIAP
jgi:hypothetical protein